MKIARSESIVNFGPRRIDMQLMPMKKIQPQIFALNANTDENKNTARGSDSKANIQKTKFVRNIPRG